MSRPNHDHTSLGAYALGVLTPHEATEVEAHLAACPDGRREVAELVGLRQALDSVPPEAFIDGPPPGGDLLLQRTLRKVRSAEGQEPETRQQRPAARRLIAVAAAVVIAGGALVGGIAIGAAGNTTPGQEFSAADANTHAALDVKVEKLSGWVKVHAMASGIKMNEPCQLVVTAKDGSQRIAGSWLVSSSGESKGTSLDGAALVAPQDVKSIDVITTDNRKLVSVPVTL